MATPTIDLPPTTCEEEVTAPILDNAQGLASAIGAAAVAAVAVGDGLTHGLGRVAYGKPYDGHISEEDGQFHDVDHKGAREAKQQKSLREAQEKWDAATMGPVTRVETVIARKVEEEMEEESGRYGREEEEEEGQKGCTCRLEKALMWQVNSSGSLSGASPYNATNTAVAAAASNNSPNNLNFTQTGRVTKSRHRSSLSAPIAASLVNAAATESARLSYEAKLTAALAANVAGTMAAQTNGTTPILSTASSMDKDAPVISFWGPEPIALPSRFARIKRNLISGHEAELEASWARLITALRKEVSHIEDLGAHLIPSIEFGDLDDSVQTARFGHDLRRYGVGVVRKVVPRADTDTAVRETVDYLDSKRHIKALQQHDPACFDFFWTPAQVRSRAHPNVLSAQRFMMSLWETNPDDQLVTRLPITYVDRIRVHGNGENQSNSLNVPPLEPPQSADDWIQALQSSAGITAQVDNGLWSAGSPTVINVPAPITISFMVNGKTTILGNVPVALL
ncbi:hypothetical protein FocnCong_v005616 [Fusarium oxysporum f. sp. conglutinans]|nr:hypothetical protein FocnCong_v005616 [Fusarium oxysporum f. sp. conglutinans]